MKVLTVGQLLLRKQGLLEGNVCSFLQRTCRNELSTENYALRTFIPATPNKMLANSLCTLYGSQLGLLTVANSSAVLLAAARVSVH
jgi:hypothetical protein